MQGSPAAEGDHGEGGNVLAVFDGVHAGCVGHVLVDDLGHAGGRRFGVHGQCGADRAIQRVTGCLVVQVDAGSPERVGRQAT